MRIRPRALPFSSCMVCWAALPFTERSWAFFLLFDLNAAWEEPNNVFISVAEAVAFALSARTFAVT